ncbi:Hypothetical predicted protein, partial [Mytilus galloprovincialis]
APFLAIRKRFACNESRGIEISCIGRGELPVDNFGLWIHTFNGHFIRNLTGTRQANISTIVLSCSNDDEGDYLCQAWTRIKDIRQLNNVSNKVVIQGPPKVTEKYLKKVHGEYELSLQVYSASVPIKAEWYKGTDQIANSSIYTQTVAEVLTHRRMYGKVITAAGYSVKLAIKKTSADIKKTKIFSFRDKFTWTCD